MAAGEGKRMNSSIPKVLHLFNQVPMLVRIINESNKLNPSKIIIITGKYDELIKETLKLYLNEIFEKLTFVQQKSPNGTGDAINSTLHLYNKNENVLILNGDTPLISYYLLNNFIKLNHDALLLVAKLDNPYGYGRILYNNEKVFSGIKEEKDANEEEKKINIVNVGIYYFTSEILQKYIPLIDNINVQNEYYLTDIVKIIKNTSTIDIKTHLIEEELKYQILGVNTQAELLDLENKYKNV
jgi:bifunctional N-acetylglucosamine-1-phosphate-uridyltransferase/glucosamine-1-phosphate-acetyltransferase GlmU-like protein